MGDRAVDSDGNVYERGWDGGFHPAQGIFGQQRETDFFGNPKVERDFLGSPKAKTNWLGGQEKSSNGRALYEGGGGSGGYGGGGADLGGAIGGFIAYVLLLGLFLALFWTVKLLYGLCRDHPKVGYPVVGALLLSGAIVVASSSGSPTGVAARGNQASVLPAVPAAPMPVPGARSPSSPSKLVVDNTDGQGVYIRRSPALADKLRAWPDGTTLGPTGRSAQGDGLDWVEVRDPAGNLGWVPARYVVAQGQTQAGPSGPPSQLIVANTDGEGVYLRRTPSMTDRLRAWPDGTKLAATGHTTTAEGLDWFEVTDPAGNRGWVPAKYVIPGN